MSIFLKGNPEASVHPGESETEEEKCQIIEEPKEEQGLN